MSGRATVDLVPILRFDGVEADWASSGSFRDGLSLLVFLGHPRFHFCVCHWGPSVLPLLSRRLFVLNEHWLESLVSSSSFSTTLYVV